uniref:Enhancer of polycomb-like protein n=1 Tax=Steinernema glaseri TaxID=37863 RepID=A0A1I8AAE0_9BILA
MMPVQLQYFRRRELRPAKLKSCDRMTVYYVDSESSELPEELAFGQFTNRAIHALPTGMNKEDEEEAHIQAVLASRDSSDKKPKIPIPRFEMVDPEDYQSMYPVRGPAPEGLIRVSDETDSDNDSPSYNADKQDEEWLRQRPPEEAVETWVFEKIMEKLNRTNPICSTSDVGNVLWKYDKDIANDVYYYWLQKTYKTTSDKVFGLVAGLHPYTRDRKSCRRRRRDQTESITTLAKGNALASLLAGREHQKKFEVLEKYAKLESTFGVATSSTEAHGSLRPARPRNDPSPSVVLTNCSIDGKYQFVRQPGCSYRAPLLSFSIPDIPLPAPERHFYEWMERSRAEGRRIL